MSCLSAGRSNNTYIISVKSQYKQYLAYRQGVALIIRVDSIACKGKIRDLPPTFCMISQKLIRSPIRYFFVRNLIKKHQIGDVPIF